MKEREREKEKKNILKKSEMGSDDAGNNSREHLMFHCEQVRDSTEENYIPCPCVTHPFLPAPCHFVPGPPSGV